MKRLFFLCLIAGLIGACSDAPEKQTDSDSTKTDTERATKDSVAKQFDSVGEQESVLRTRPKSIPGAGIPLDAAKVLYRQLCAACHGIDGEGATGPNLTDAYWLHGNKRFAVMTAIRYGRSNKGMPGFIDQCTTEEQYGLADYILQLPPKKGKEPEGIEIK